MEPVNPISQAVNGAVSAATAGGVPVVSDPLTAIIVGVVTAVPIIVYIYRQVKRVFTKDNLELVKDRAETNIVKTLQDESEKLRNDLEKERERSDKISEERNAAIQQLGKMAAESEMNRDRIGELQQAIQTMTSKLEEQSKLLQEVLIENAQLKEKISSLDTINTMLGNELSEIKTLLKEILPTYKSTQ